MRITDVRAMILSYEYDTAIGDAMDFFFTRNTVLVQVYTDEGIVGLGEAAFFGGPPETTKFVLENELKPMIIGEDPTMIERVWKRMFDRTRKHGRGGVLMSAISGIDIALWDIMGKKTGMPVYKLLGGYTNKLLPYASCGFYAEGKGTKEIANEVEEYFKLGFKCAKIKVGRDPEVIMTLLQNMANTTHCLSSLEEDMERVKACLEVANKYGARLMVDANNSWNTFTAMEMCRKFEKMGILWVEEPLQTDDLDGYAALASSLDIAISGIESETGGLYRFKQIIDKRAVDIVQCDVIWSGGFTECRKIANYAYANFLPVIPHVFSTAVSLIANMHFLASLSNGGMLEYDRNIYPLRDELVTHRVTVEKDGYVYLPEGPGLGIELNMDTVEKYRID
ncbi:MAG: mandelate racemase/muconate lactonizing enzyme family protein [Christensenellales bacterium]